MPVEVQFRRGNTSQHSTFTGAAGEITVDTDKKTVVVHDGSTVGGTPLHKENAPLNTSNVTATNVLTVSGTVSSNLIPTANVTYSLGNTTNRWANLYLSGNTIVLGDQTISSNSSGVNLSGTVYNNGVQLANSTNITLGNVSINAENILLGNNSVNTNINATSIFTSGKLEVTANATFSNNVTIAGDLTVSGTQTILNTQTLTVNDNVIVINQGASDPASEEAGIEVDRGSANSVFLLWNETTDKWVVVGPDTVVLDIATNNDVTTAYTNATAFAANADNISSGTLNTARLPATANIATAINVGSNVNITVSSISIGNSSVNTIISAETITLNGVNVNTAITGNAATAYTNATSFSANADNITSGTLNTARLPATANVSTAINVGANVNLSTTTISIGNSSVNTIISAETITLNGVNVNTAITGNAATAYTNATSYITTYASNADNITSGTLNTARLPATANVSTEINVGANVSLSTTTISVGNSSVNTQITGSGITANGANITSVNAATVGSNTASDLRTYSETKAGDAYTNATSYTVSYASNADNISSGTLNTARLPATANVSTAINVGANVNLSTSSISVGNSTFNTYITSTSLNTGNTTIVGYANVSSTIQVTGAATFSNDVTIAGNLTVNGTRTYVDTTTLDVGDNIITLNADVGGAVAPTENAGIEINRGSSANVSLRWNESSDIWQTTTDGTTFATIATNNDVTTAYTNATSFSANADNITSGTLNTARLPATANVSTEINVGANVNLTTSSISVGNSSVNTQITSSGITANGANITSVNAATVGSNTASDLRTYSETKAGDAYTNATAFSANADNISSGTLNTARLPATANIATAINVGSNVNITVSNISIGNSSVNTQITAEGITANGSNITSVNAATVGSNSALDLRAYSETKAGDAYTNATSFSANADNITSGTLSTARLPATANVSTEINVGANVNLSTTTISVGNSSVNTQITGSGITANGANITSVNAATVGSNTASDLRGYSETKAGDAYTNATAFAANADNISSGTLNTARLPATANIATAINVGSNVTIDTTSIKIGNSTVNTTITAGNVQVLGSSLSVGNSTVNTTITGSSITANGASFSGDVSFTSNIAGNNVSLSGSLVIDGNLTVSGNTVTISTSTLSVKDNMIYMNQGINATITNIVGNGSVVVFTANNNFANGWDVTVTGVTPSSYNGTYSDILEANSTSFSVSNTNIDSYTSGGTARGKTDANPDLGIAAGYNDGTYHHTGVFRDATDGRWKFFHEYTPEPDANVYIDTAHASFALANVQANYFIGTLSGDASTVGSNSASDLRTYSETKAGDAYTNATAFAANADNISSGTLNTARLPATANVSTAINIGANVNLSTTTISVGNSSVNTQITGSGITANGANITSVNAATVGSNTASDLRGYSETKAGDAYTNATAFAANADNISSGTLNTARLPATANVTTAINVGSNVNITVSSISVGNSSVNTQITAEGITANGTNITSVNAATVGSNSALDLRAYSETKAGDAYTNATSFSANADNITSGTLSTSRLPATANVSTAINVGANVNLSTTTISVGNSSVNTQITGSGITANGANITSVNAATVGSNTASDLRSYSETKASDAYTNATAFAANADNITSGTLSTARLPATANVSTEINVGANVNLSTTTISVGNSSVNTQITSSSLNTGNTTITGYANVSTTLQVTGIATFSNDVVISGNLTVSGTRTFVNTTTLDVGDNIITLNADLPSTAPTENAGIEINRGSSANVVLRWNETNDIWQITTDGTNYNTIATNSDITTAYTNATAFSANADNITSGTLATARLPATANIATAINVGSNVNLTTSTITIGNSSINTSISAETITLNGVNVNTAITGNAATAYTNATAFSANADNITSGTLNTARLPATANVSTEINVGANVNLTTSTINVGNSTVNTAITGGTLSTNTVTVRTTLTLGSAGVSANGGLGTSGQVLTSNGSASYWSTISAGATITDDTSTNATRYILFDDVTSGTASSIGTSSTKLYFNPSTGQLSATDFNSLSDMTLKDNISLLDNGLDKICQINPVSFTWKDSGKKASGILAQEIEKILPEIVHTNEKGVKSVSYMQLIAFLISAVKEQQDEINKLKKRKK